MKRLLAALCAFTLVLSFAPFHAFALTSPPDPGTVITGSDISSGNSGNGWQVSSDGQSLSLTSSGPYTLQGINNLRAVVLLDTTGDVTITLKNVSSNFLNINCMDANLRLYSEGDNTIRSIATANALSIAGDGILFFTEVSGTGDILVKGQGTSVICYDSIAGDNLTVEDGASLLVAGSLDITGDINFSSDAIVSGPVLMWYTVTVYGGTSDFYEAIENQWVNIQADNPARGEQFSRWGFAHNDLSFPALVEDSSNPQTRFKMPGHDVVVSQVVVPLREHTLTVNGGAATVDSADAGGIGFVGETITITADAPAPGQVFGMWMVDSSNVTLADENEATTTFTMPGADVEVTATYKDAPVALAFTTDAALPGATLNQTYSANIEATGGSTPYTFSLVDNSPEPPNGITLNPDGTLSGTPTETGTFPFEVKVTDGANAEVRKTFTFVVSSGSGPAVTSVTVTGEGGADTITTKGGTLQLSAQVLPADAAQTVTWSIVGSAATLSDTALLTAVSNGTVTVRAASTQDPTVYGELVVTISGQDDGNGNGNGNGGGNSGDTTRRRPSSSDGEASWTPATVTFTGVPTGAIKVGDPFTVIPSYDDQTGSAGWEYDSSFFSATFNSPATFTALKEGTSTITYTTLDGVTSSFTVTVGAAAASADPAAPAPEGAAAGGEDAKIIPVTGARA